MAMGSLLERELESEQKLLEPQSVKELLELRWELNWDRQREKTRVRVWKWGRAGRLSTLSAAPHCSAV